MTGILEMFSEYENAELDWFQLQFCFEREYERHLEHNRESGVMVRMRRRDKHRIYMRSYDKQRKATDPAYLEARRKTAREANRRLYARKKALRAA